MTVDLAYQYSIDEPYERNFFSTRKKSINESSNRWIPVGQGVLVGFSRESPKIVYSLVRSSFEKVYGAGSSEHNVCIWCDGKASLGGSLLRSG